MVFLGLGWNVFAQQDPVLMRINGKDVLRSEFEYSYNRDKSLLALKHATPGKYVEHFVNFKLKVGDAEAAGLDTAFAFREEVENYRSPAGRIIPDRYGCKRMLLPAGGMTG